MLSTYLPFIIFYCSLYWMFWNCSHDLPVQWYCMQYKDLSWYMRIIFRDQKSKYQSSKTYHSTLLTLAAVFFIAVVHAVKHIITAPTPRDTVSTIQTKELVFPALLHTANLPANENRKSTKLSLSVMFSHWMIHVLTSIHDLINSSSPLNYCTPGSCTAHKKPYFLIVFFISHTALTSSEPSRQLSCPSHRRLADTHPPLAHTYSLTEHVGTAGEGQSVLVNIPPFLT